MAAGALTGPLLIINQTDCIYLEIDEPFQIQEDTLRELIEKAKALASERGVVVLFCVYSFSQMFQVSSESDTDELLAKYYDRYNCSMIIK